MNRSASLLPLVLPLLLPLLLLVPLVAPAQTPQTLPALIAHAQHQSVAAQAATTARDVGHWQWRRYRADFRPQVALVGTLPDFSRAITPVVQPDGTTEFRAVRLNSAVVQLAVTQNLAFTGGQLTVASGMQRFDDFNARARRYNAQPLSVGLSQPLRGFNALAWARRLEPLRYDESQRQRTEDVEQIAPAVAERFFDVLLQQQQAALAAQNERLAEELLRLGREKEKLGRVSTADVLLLELNYIRAQQARSQAEIGAQSAALDLRMTAGLAPEAPLHLLVPDPAPAPAVAPAVALARARERRPAPLTFARRRLEAARAVAEARYTGGLQASLTANLGYINRAETFWNSYATVQEQQQIRVGFSLPIIDWGRQRAAVQLAEAQRALTERSVGQDEQTFEQAVLTQAHQLPVLAAQSRRAARADSLAQRRFAITQDVYKVGRLSLTDLGIAQQEKDAARRAYLDALRAAWLAHYRLRALTLYDFVRDEGL